MDIHKKNAINPAIKRTAGYAALIEQFNMDVIPNWHKSMIATRGIHRIKTTAEVVEETYPAKYWPGNKASDHLEFALKYDGTNLAILAELFRILPTNDILDYVKKRPTGKYARRIWFLYELMTDKQLPLNDLTRGNYIDLLDPDDYYTIKDARLVRRQRINNNLPGDFRFCPIIRRTDILRDFEKSNLPMRCRKIFTSYPPQLLKRAMSYLYTKETKSSFAIEHIKPNSTRTERFVALLHLAGSEDFCEKNHLIDLQNRIVDPRFGNTGYRNYQNYVGETIALQREKVHFTGPKPEDLDELMRGLITTHQRMEAGNVSPVIHAAAVAYGFVFIHPFEDGNGRIHRFLIHNILARRGFMPPGVIFPVSAAMLKNMAEYDASLESFSRPLMTLVDYSLDNHGQMVVRNNTANWYKYIDMTAQAEALFRFIERTIATELTEELEFLANYDQAKKAIQQIIDMPDHKIDLIIHFCLQNNGRLSTKKRTDYFEFLTDAEVPRIETAIQSAYGKT